MRVEDVDDLPPKLRAQLQGSKPKRSSKPRRSPEQDFQDQVVEYAGLRGWTVMHVRKSVAGRDGNWVTTTSVKGWPDLTLYRERILFREVKAEGGVVTPEQKAVIDGLIFAGGDAGVWFPKDWPRIEKELK